MYKICLVVNGLSFGGVEQVIFNYFKDYNKPKFQVDIITQREISVQKDIERFSDLGFKIHLVTHKRKNLFKNYSEIKAILKNGHYDIVHSHMSNMNFYVLRLAKKYGTKVRINHYHNVFNCGRAKQLFIKICNRLCDKYATNNIFCSNAVAEYFGKTKKESIVLTNAIDIERFKFNKQIRDTIRKQHGIEDDEFIIGHVGRFVDQKNHSFLVDVFNEYHKINPRSKLLLCGDGPLRIQIEQRVKDYNLTDKVIFTGVQKQPEQYYQAFDCFLLPSLYEGLPVVGVEAQINGLPIITSTTVSRDLDITGNVEFISLDETPAYWATAINNYDLDYDRFSSYKKLKGSIFDIKSEATKLFCFYEEKIRS